MRDVMADPTWLANTVRMAKKGNIQAFDDLVKKFDRLAVSHAYRLLGKGEDARDVAQEALLKAFKNLGQLDDPARFVAWLLRIVHTQSLNFRRGRALRTMQSIDHEHDGESGGSLKLKLAEEEGEVQTQDQLSPECREKIYEAMQQLPDRHREVLTLFQIAGKSQKEVADMLGISVAMVKLTVYEAKQKLKPMLADMLDESKSSD